MEEIYTLPDGSTVDISSYSQFQKTLFLMNNAGAKKSKGTAKSASALPKKNAQSQEFQKVTEEHRRKMGMVSKSGSGSSGSKKYRLLTEADVDKARKKGVLPPPSTIRFSEGDLNADSYEYDFKGNLSKKLNKPLPEYKYGKDYKPKHEETREVYLANKDNTSVKIDKKLNTETEYETNRVDVNGVPDPFLNDLKIRQLEREKAKTDSALEHPYLYYSSYNQEKPDSFVKDNFNEMELEDLGINAQDFDGFLNKNKYKEDFLDKEQRGLFTKGTGVAGYDVELAKELQKKKLLTLYMSNMQSRDITRQTINQDIEITKGIRDKRDIKENVIFDSNKLINYVEKNFPIYTQKLKESEAKSRKIYEEAKTGGTDFWSWDTASKMTNATWNGFTNRVHQFSATVYDKIGMKDTAEYSRFMADQDAVETPDDRSVGYVGGKETYVDGKKYLVSSKGDVYDADLKIRITDILEPKKREKIYENSKYGESGFVFSPQGVAIGTSAVIGDMILQAALTRGVGAFGTVATETRLALSVAGKQTQASQLFNSASSALKMIPMKRSTGYAMISQGALGYSQGFEETLKAARENGINDKEAFALASNAAQRMGALYATTGVINPQTNVVDNLFTAKNVVKKAIEQYTKTGKKGFIQSIDDVVRNTPRNLVEFAEEGGKEVVQENVQQAGEIGLNKLTNQEAGKKILNEEYTASDFINTSILSFISSGLISKAKLPNFKVEDNDVNDLTSLSKLAKNKVQFTKTLDGLVDTKVFTIDEANKLKADVDTYSNNINKLRRDIPPSAAMPVMRELDKITKLENQKKSVDKAFHEEIDLEIEGIRENIKKTISFNRTSETIFSAIKKGVVKNIQMKTFSDTASVKSYLMEELNFPEELAERQSKQGGMMLDSNILKELAKDPNTIKDGQKILIVNEGKSDGEAVSHEFLHGLIYETVKNDPETQQLLGMSLANELFKIRDLVEQKGSKENPLPDEFIQRFGQYTAKYDKLQNNARVKYQNFETSKEEYQSKVENLLGNQWEEVLTLYSDAIFNGAVKYDEGVFSKLKDVLRRVFQKIGIRDIKFESGRDVYNFIRDYNHSVKNNSWGVAMKKLGNSKAFVNKENLKKETEFTPFSSKIIKKSEDVFDDGKNDDLISSRIKNSLAERKSSEDIKKDVNKNYDKDKWGAGSALNRDENPAIERVLYDILSEYDYIIKGKAKVLNFANTPGYNDMDMISETYIQLMPHIRNFNKEFLQKREEFKKELINNGLEPNSVEFKQKLEEQDKKGYQGKKGIVRENDDLNAWINSQLVNKMNAAMKSGNVSEEAFTDDIEGEMFKESNVLSDFSGDQGYLMDEGDNVFDSEEDFAQEQNKLAVLLSDPIYRFVDEDGKPIDIETVPFGGFFVTDISDPSIAANIKLRTETDTTKIAELKKELKDLKRGLELQNKQDITFEEKEELKQLKSFKSYDLSTGMMVNTFKALSIQDTPAKIITDEVGREILRSPNIQTLEYRNFKEKLSTLSKTMARRMTFKNGPEIESLMYNEWKLLYDVINHPVDAVTGQSSYASKKLPPRLKEIDEKGNFKKIENINRAKFLQSYYGIDEAARIIKTYGSKDVEKDLSELEEPELSEKDGNALRPTTYFDRRTALMELFGDVLVLQEARRLIRNPEFLDRVSQRNVNLYNELKDDVIRASVLNDMSKGKSDLVKFSLAKTDINKKPDEIEAMRNDFFSRIGNKLNVSIKNNSLSGSYSSPDFDERIKYSLADITNNPLEGYNKKFEIHYKGTSSYIKENTLYEASDEENKNLYVKALMLSDIKDTETGTKLHTFKSYDDIEKEVIRRVEETFENMSIPVGMSDRTLRVFGETSVENPYVIKRFNENYLKYNYDKAVKEEDEENITYYAEMLNNEDFRDDELVEKQRLQQSVLVSLIENLTAKDKKLMFSPFYTYLFLNDVLSNRYQVSYENKTVERKGFKKSEYATTIEPISGFVDATLIDSMDDFIYSNSLYPVSVYNLQRIENTKQFEEDFEKNRKIAKIGDYGLFKFKQSEEANDVDSLFNLASLNEKFESGKWCTGQNLSIAEYQLAAGDFYIVANDSYIPIFAIRTKAGQGYIDEIVGVEEDQTFKASDLPLLYEALSFIDSDQNFKANYSNTIKQLNDFVNNRLSKDQELEFYNNYTKIRRGRFALENWSKTKKDIKALEKTLLDNNLIIVTPLRSIVSEEKIDDDGFEGYSYINLENNENDKINQDGVWEGDFSDVLFEEKSLNKDLLPEVEVLHVDIKAQGGILIFDKLEEISRLNISAESIVAPKLKTGEAVNITSYYSNDFQGLVEFNESVKFNINANVTVQPYVGFFVFSEKEIDLNGYSLRLDVLFENKGELSSIDLSQVKNADYIYLKGIANSIDLPKKAKELFLVIQNNELVKEIDVIGGQEIELLNIEMNRDYFRDISKINLLEDSKIEKTRIQFDGTPTDKEIENILKSDIGLSSKKIEVIFFKDGVRLGSTIKDSKNNIEDIEGKIKFSLAEEDNGKLNTLLENLPFAKQWVVARDIDTAINKGRAAEGINIEFIVPNRSTFSDKQNAYFIIQKVAEGFNDFKFEIEENSKGPLTKQVLDALDVKSKEYQQRAERNSNIEKTINDFIEENKGVASTETFSPETAKNIGKNIGKYEMYLPPEDEDFLGLLYTLAGAKGKKGNEQLKFLTDTLLKPYSDAMLNLMKARQTMYKDWQDLINKKHKGISKLLKQDSGYGGYLVDQAVRVYLWSAAGYDIPGLDKKDLFNLREIVRTNPKLRSFASDVSLLSKQANGYTEPGHNWGFGSVVSDINGVISKSNRKKYLEQWQNNVDKAFSKDNLSKIEAVYGRKYVTALKNTLDRMKTGSNRAEGSNDAFLNWLNGATAVTMFTNIRSAFLQTLGAVNYLNTSDNNIVKAGAAFLNVPQFLKDFKTIWNSDYSKDRRSGLTNDIAEAELAQIMNDPRNKSILDKFKAANYWILKKGYGPTRFADSFAIAFGGASFYRNRLNAYMKEGKTEAEAEKETMRDFYEVSESSQQSADVSKISMNQASTKGRLLLSFLNTPFQYSRIIKRSVVDLAKGRGDVANNIAKIVYYSAIQNIMFNFLQNALFSIIWDDDDERDKTGKGKFDQAKIRAVSGSLDTLLRGSGLQGVIISTVKNIILKWYEKSGDPKGYGDVLLEAANLAPSIGIKTRALAKSYKAVEYNRDEIEYKGFSLDNTYALEALTSLTSAATNVPVDRLMQKFENVSNALNEEYEAWQRVAFAMGYNKWNLGISDEKNVSTNAAGELKIPELKQEELKMPELK